MRTPIQFADVKVGDSITFICNGRGRGGHFWVTVQVTKKNRKTFDGTECFPSYMPGTLWRVSSDTYLELNRILPPEGV